ncbi:Blue-light photoreceptor [Vreelandella boliviensis LC1]|uniref:Blue-light photoreceptor n=1 Tax=Vreelandella boliviensis LC1 TaxID=1072583 RepID=A0A7U9C1M0_9GAMM|nr:Blue-light photoreceptor [Halomonas boliviensis LC1]
MISPELLERIVDASEDGIVVAEQEGDENILIYVNKGFERLTGYSADEILYRDCRFLQNEDRDQDALAVIRDALKDGHPSREVLRNYRKDGTMFWNELSITPVYDEADKLMYYIGVQKDVTERVEAQLALTELQKQRENG